MVGLDGLLNRSIEQDSRECKVFINVTIRTKVSKSDQKMDANTTAGKQRG